MKFLNQKQFENLNSGMKVSYILSLAHHAEKQWDNFGIRLLTLKSLSQYSSEFQATMTLSEFQAVQTELEFRLKASVRDDEFIVTTSDRNPDQIRQTTPLVIILENLRSAFNVGAIFRAADCLGIQEVRLCGYTPTPNHAKVLETAMGTSNIVPWRQFSTITEALADLNSTIVAVETIPAAQDITRTALPKNCALLFGNERQGLSQNALDSAGMFLKIPLLGMKNSMNVAACMSICSFEYNRQHSGVKPLC